VPHEIFYALDRDMQCKTASQANLRFTVQGAAELVEAAHGGRWDKYAPYQPLPSKSALRLLKINEHQYEDLYLTVEDYLRKGVLQKPEEEQSSSQPDAVSSKSGADDMHHDLLTPDAAPEA